MVEGSDSRSPGGRHERMETEEDKVVAENLKKMPVRTTRFFIEDILSPDFGRSCSASKHTPSTPLPRHRVTREDSRAEGVKELPTSNNSQWPAWVYCTRYSDRPSSGPRMRKVRRRERKQEEKRPRTAFTSEQLERLRREFDRGHYLTERRRRELAVELALNESQIKIWFQNKRAKLKKARQDDSALAAELKRQGLYNHSTLSASDSAAGLQ